MVKDNTKKKISKEPNFDYAYNPSSQSSLMMPKWNKWLPIIYGVLFAAFAFFMLVVKNSDYLYAAQEHSLFLFDKSFFDMIMVKPGALMTYLGCFFTQFFYYPALGSAILIAIWLITYTLTIKAFKLNGFMSCLALLPVAALLCSETIIGYWFYYNKHQGYWFEPSIALMINMLMIWGQRIAKEKSKRNEMILIGIWGVVGYIVTGWLGLLSTIIMGLTDIIKTPKARIIPMIEAISLVIVVPIISYQFTTQMRIDDAWIVGFPIFETEYTDSTRPWYPFIALPAILLILGLIQHSIDQNQIKKYSKTAWSLIIMQIVCIAAIVGCELASDFDNYNYHCEMRMHRATDESRWQDVLDEAANWKEAPTREMVLLKDIALIRQGKIGDYMFKYNTKSQDPYTYDSLGVHMAQTNAPLVYLNYSRINFAIRWSIENAVECGFNPIVYKTLTRCAIIAGENDLARKYISILKKTLFYKDWAETYEKFIGNSNLIAESTELGPIYEYYTNYRNMLDSDEGLVEMYLMNYFSNTMNKDNKLVQETTLAFTLLSKDIQKFWPRFFLYAHLHEGEPMPIHYQEAAMLYGSLEQEVDIKNMPFDQDRIIARYASFNQMSNTLLQQGKSSEEIGEIMRPLFGDTFWWFYFFCRGLVSY